MKYGCIVADLDANAIGKAGEHLVALDLIEKGLQVSMSAEGLPYDLVAGGSNGLSRVQVKATSLEPRDIGKNKACWRFGLRRARGNRTRYDADNVDVFAFAFLTRRTVAYLPMALLLRPDGLTKTNVDWRPKELALKRDGRGHRIPEHYHVRYVEDFYAWPI